MKKVLSKEEVSIAVDKALQEQKMLFPKEIRKSINRVVDELFPKETLADWPGGWDEGERGSLGGMWADVWNQNDHESRLRIMSNPNWDPVKGTALVYWPGNEKGSAESEISVALITPRFDLQRAWSSSDGPVAEVSK